MKPTLITPAKFALLHGGTYSGENHYPQQAHGAGFLSQAATIELGGLRFYSDSPISATHAEAINVAIRRMEQDGQFL